MDGAVARAGNTQSEFGNFFDSTIDRIADAVIIFAVVFMPMHNEYYFVVRNQIFVVGSLTILTASLISYTRAKAESLGVKGEFGILPRPERWFLILVMILSQKWVLILSVLAILGLITVAQRIWSIGKLLR
jgi:phosphatidylglycerophosphate synthase